MNKIAIVLGSALIGITGNAYANISVTEQTHDVTYDSTSTFKPTGSQLLQDAGVNYSSDHDIVLVTLDGQPLDEAITLIKGSHTAKLNIWDMDQAQNPSHKEISISYEVKDIDYPVEIISQIETPTFNLNQNITALDFAKKYVEVDAKDGLVFALMNQSQAVNTAESGNYSSMLQVVDINGDTDQIEVNYNIR
ncbi:hypothetical protein ACPV36_01345 [Photobacterium damselae]|uniref:hypothetical protein n=1 Tax=Photobacterium damselae TaxID=38293 RepID=UPI0040688300